MTYKATTNAIVINFNLVPMLISEKDMPEGTVGFALVSHQKDDQVFVDFQDGVSAKLKYENQYGQLYEGTKLFFSDDGNLKGIVLAEKPKNETKEKSVERVRKSPLTTPVSGSNSFNRRYSKY